MRSNETPPASEAPGQAQPFPLAGVRGQPIRPIPAELLDSILDRKPSFLRQLAANDRALREHNRAAMGGNLGLAIFVFAVIFMVALIATGGRL